MNRLPDHTGEWFLVFILISNGSVVVIGVVAVLIGIIAAAVVVVIVVLLQASVGSFLKGQCRITSGSDPALCQKFGGSKRERRRYFA